MVKLAPCYQAKSVNDSALVLKKTQALQAVAVVKTGQDSGPLNHGFAPLMMWGVGGFESVV